MQPISKKLALEHSLKKYFTGKPCKRGHISQRYTRNSVCIDCDNFREKDRKARTSNKNTAVPVKRKRVSLSKNTAVPKAAALIKSRFGKRYAAELGHALLEARKNG